jgi:4-hydroxy-tetrahydrodipicolinate reductase
MKLAIAGCGGRMGRMLIEAALAATDDFSIACALERAGAAQIGQDCALFLGRHTGVTITSDVSSIEQADVLIDFTRPEATLQLLQACVKHGVRAVIGTTGFDEEGRRQIEQAARSVPVVFSPNMSVGVNVAFRLVELAARMLSEDFDVEIIEAHHHHKVDAPSGTSLRLGELVASSQGHSLQKVAVHARHGVTGPRQPGTIGFSVIRGGDMVGDHTVMFAGAGERVEITHRASSRMTYALGALRAARFLAQREPGLYDMRDVLGLG